MSFTRIAIARSKLSTPQRFPCFDLSKGAWRGVEESCKGNDVTGLAWRRTRLVIIGREEEESRRAT